MTTLGKGLRFDGDKEINNWWTNLLNHNSIYDIKPFKL